MPQKQSVAKDGKNGSRRKGDTVANRMSSSPRASRYGEFNPSADEIAEVAAEIRAGWSVYQRWKSRVSVLAIKTDDLDGFVWPASDEADQVDDDEDALWFWEGGPAND